MMSEKKRLEFFILTVFSRLPAANEQQQQQQQQAKKNRVSIAEGSQTSMPAFLYLCFFFPFFFLSSSSEPLTLGRVWPRRSQQNT